jgi:sulfate permease, SulP family
MRRRIEAVVSALPELTIRPAHALRQAIGEGYSARNFRQDVMSGLVVGIVALPLSMALAIASGVPPQHGLYTAIIAGGLIALLGGSRVQVSGPTAAFVVILAPISAKYGLAGLCVASFFAGVLLFLMGVLRFGQLIQFIPYPVTTGFTAGIAVVIATLQLKDFFGLTLMGGVPEHYIDKVAALGKAMPTMNWPDLVIGVGTLIVLIVWPRIMRKVPAPLVALPLAAIAAIVIAKFAPSFDIATINNRFSYTEDLAILRSDDLAIQEKEQPAASANHQIATSPHHQITKPGIPQSAPHIGWPWQFLAPGEAALTFDYNTIRALLLSAFAIAMLGAIESLLSAVVSDGMTGFTHDPNAELMAQGVGNMAAPFFGGFAATGAIARTATNVRSGGRSPIASITHALFILVAMLGAAPLLGYLPMASLAALLLIVAKNMSEMKHFFYVLRVGPRSDVAVLITCFALTVIFDMVVAVSTGIVLAAVLFMRRMAEVSGVKLVGDEHPHLAEPLPKGVLLYEINGPLFFGAAQKAMSSLHLVGNDVKVVILDMESVPAVDATGLVNLQSTIRRLHNDRILIILGSVQPQPMEVLTRAGLEELDSRIGICTTLDEAVNLAKFHLALGEDLHAAHVEHAVHP